MDNQNVQAHNGGPDPRMKATTAKHAFGSGRTRTSRYATKHPPVPALLAKVLTKFRWTYSDIVADPLGAICLATHPVQSHWELMVALFKLDDIVWIGRDCWDTGKPGHRYRFRPAGDWLKKSICPGAYICPNTFKPSVYIRSNANIAERRFMVIESDTLDKNQIGAVFRFVAETFEEMTIRAIVDTGNKSVHGWFDYPSSSSLPLLRKLLAALNCDDAMFGPSQPARLPGIVRPETGRFQRIIYFNDCEEED
jgi:hypothetical protein